MTLEQYRLERGWSYGQLAKVLDCGHSRMTSRWCKGEVIPAREYMARIMELTNGAVQPNDFYREKK